MGHKTILHYRRRRYVCIACNKRFPEKNSFVEKYHKISMHTKKLIIKEYKDIQSIKSIGKRLNISSHTVMRHIQRHIHPKRLKLPRIISIDEFKNLSTGKGKYAFLMVDPLNKQVIDVYFNRQKRSLENYFSKIPIEERNKVEIVVSDLWDPYRRLVKRVFPNAILIADKYHFIRQLYWALQAIRIRVMKQFKTGSIEYYLLKKYWKLYLKYRHKLSPYHFKNQKLGYHVTAEQIVEWGKSLHPDLRFGCDLKDEFYEIMHTATPDTANELISNFIYKLKQSNINELKEVAKTYQNWKPQIINSFYREVDEETGEIVVSNLTNGFIEGINNKIKVIKRVAYNYRNFWNFRTRIFSCINPNITISS